MKKRISLLSLCLGLFIAACTDSSGFEDLQNFSEKEVMPRAAGDGIYDVLGYGYDITSDYLGEASVHQPVLDVEAFIRDNKGCFDNPFIGTIEQKVTAGEDAWSFLQQTISNTNFSGSVAAMGKSDTSKGFFSGSITTGFKSDSKYSYSSKYSFARAEVIKKQRQYLLYTNAETLSRYLSSNFIADLNKYSADEIVRMYGTHVLTKITVGGSYRAYYKSVIVEEANRTEKMKTVTAGAKYNMKKVGLDANGSWNTTTITETNKKNSNWTCDIKCLGGTTSGTTITLSPNQGPTTTINLGAWTQSVDDTHSRLVDVDWNATYPIYDLVSDPVKKADLKLAVEKYINSKKISVIKLVTLYQLYWPKGVNCHWCTSWSEVLRYKNEGHEYSGVFGYICAEEEPGTLPLYRMYWSKGRNSHYITSWAEVRKFQNEGHEYQGIVGYIYTWNEVNTIPVYSLYYPKGRDSHYLTDKAEVDRFIRERGDQYGGILGYVYP